MTIKRKIIMILVFLVFIFSISVSIPTTSYIIEGDKVYIDNENATISAKPHTITGSKWVSFNLTSKKYSGNVNILFGFDNVVRPKKALLYRPAGIDVEYNFTCSAPFWFNYTLLPNHFWCWHNISEPVTGENMSMLMYNHSFLSANPAKKTAYWNRTEYWYDITDKFGVFNYNYDNKTKWYYLTNIPIVANNTYTMEAYIEVPNKAEYSSKYDIGIYPSSYGNNISGAVSDGKFYFIDPWVNGFDSRIEGLLVNFMGSGNEYRWFNATNVSDEFSTKNPFALPYFSELTVMPNGTQQAILMSLEGTGDKIYTQIWNGSNWTKKVVWDSPIGYYVYSYEQIDVEYFNNTHALAVWYSHVPAYYLAYAVWNGSNWTKRTYYPFQGGADQPFQVELACKSGNCTWIASGFSTGSFGEIYVGAWDGSDFHSNKSLTIGPHVGWDYAYGTVDNMDIIYINTTHAMATYGSYAGMRYSYSMWDSNTWTDPENFSDKTVNGPAFNEMARHKTKEELAWIGGDVNNDIKVAFWNSSHGWHDNQTICTTGLIYISTYVRHSIDVEYISNTDNVMFVFGNLTAPYGWSYKIWNGTHFYQSGTFSHLTAYTYQSNLAKDYTSNNIAHIWVDGLNDVYYTLWNGTHWDNHSADGQLLETASSQYLRPPIAFFAENLCEPPTSGEWIVNCANKCNWATAKNIPGNIRLANLTGPGTIKFSSVFSFTGSNPQISIDKKCSLYIESGGELRG